MRDQDRVGAAAERLVQRDLVGGHRAGVDMVAVSGQLGRCEPAVERGHRPVAGLSERREQVAVAVGRVGKSVQAQRQRAVSPCQVVTQVTSGSSDGATRIQAFGSVKVGESHASASHDLRPMTHAQLVQKAVAWLRSYRCSVVLSEQACASGEMPDAIGWKRTTPLDGRSGVGVIGTLKNFEVERVSRQRDPADCLDQL